MASPANDGKLVNDDNNNNDEASGAPPRRFIDIGANLLDDMYRGEYHGKARHAGDLDVVLARAWRHNVAAIMVTAGTLEEAVAARDLCVSRDHEKGRLFSTVGVHPTRAGAYDAHAGGADEYTQQLLNVAMAGAADGTVVAIGECGLDYDRLHFCDKATQQRHFDRSFYLAEQTGLPLFLHDRNTGGDFAAAVRRNRHRFTHGCVHSFTGSADELDALLELDLYIGINGCSLKTDDNLAVMNRVPSNRLLLETDAPWCEVKRTHAGAELVRTKWKSVKAAKYTPQTGNAETSVDGDVDVEEEVLVKGRCEPCQMTQVAEVVAAYRLAHGHAESERQLVDIVYENTERVFFPKGSKAAEAMLGACK
jgi:TatD DNase family protein